MPVYVVLLEEIRLQVEKEKTVSESRIPTIALRGMVIYPGTVMHFDAGREKSVAALNAAMSADKRLFVVSQRDGMKEDPELTDLYPMGTIVKVRQVGQMPDGVFRLLVDGLSRAIVVGTYELDGMIQAEICEVARQRMELTTEVRAWTRTARRLFDRYAATKENIGTELRQAVSGERDPGALADLIAANVLADLDDREAVLECVDPQLRIQLMCDILTRELQVSNIEQEIQRRVHERIDHNNRDYFLREQLHVIEEELGENDDDIAQYESRLAASAISGEARERTEKELKRLARTQTGSPESTVMQNYVECMLDLPWGVYDEHPVDIAAARNVLESDHYGLEDVKKRILEFIAVRALKKDSHGPILCLVGAPGVGKTSIARSIARALKKKFCQVSLGGVHDEAELRGHRRTYVAAMPGRIISAIKQCGSMNPVFLFDEIDKMASDMRGDPASAMLEVLDPEQNSRFRDHFLEAPFDLSHVFFIATANDVSSIPKPLYDRMEIIEVPSYTQEEKLQIARLHLWKKQLTANGLNGKNLRMSQKALEKIIDGYTREAGVRALERTLAAICRKAAMEMLDTPEAERKTVTVRPEDVEHYLGAPQFSHSQTAKAPEAGVVNGLAWTSVGGEVMPIEVAVLPGDGKLELTGSLGDVMKESAHIAWSYVRAHAEDAGLTEEYRKKHDIHVHVPEGATPKDGPSAGIALACAMFSAVTGEKARQDIAMTGELSLRGKALPIGGVKEKLLAAYRAGMNTVLLPEENRKDLEKLPENVRSAMQIQTISDASEAIATVMPGRKTTHVKAVI